MPTTLAGVVVDNEGRRAACRCREPHHQGVPRSGLGGMARPARPRLDGQTDPAPTDDVRKTIINLKPKSEWRPGLTIDRLEETRWIRRLQFPGVSNAWTMPIRARIDMLATGKSATPGWRQGVRKGPCGKSRVSPRQVDGGWSGKVPGHVRAPYARGGVIGGYYIEIVSRSAWRSGRYGLSVLPTCRTVHPRRRLGGEAVTTTVEGPGRRYTVNIRYPRRSSGPASSPSATDVQVARWHPGESNSAWRSRQA